VTAEVTPHHLCLTDEAVRSLDSNVKMNPPLGPATTAKR
jgi:dihydroorotase